MTADDRELRRSAAGCGGGRGGWRAVAVDLGGGARGGLWHERGGDPAPSLWGELLGAAGDPAWAACRRAVCRSWVGLVETTVHCKESPAWIAQRASANEPKSSLRASMRPVHRRGLLVASLTGTALSRYNRDSYRSDPAWVLAARGRGASNPEAPGHQLNPARAPKSWARRLCPARMRRGAG